MSQTQAIKQHLLAGNTITQREAAFNFNAYRLGSIIKRLRASGTRIGTRLVKRGNTRYAEYFAAHSFESGNRVRAVGFSNEGNYIAGDEGRVVEVNHRSNTMRVRVPGGLEFWTRQDKWVRIG